MGYAPANLRPAIVRVSSWRIAAWRIAASSDLLAIASCLSPSLMSMLTLRTRGLLVRVVRKHLLRSEGVLATVTKSRMEPRVCVAIVIPARVCHNRGMPKRSSTKASDLNPVATRVFEAAEEEPHRRILAVQPTVEKNPAAVELGRLGGLKGGKARAAALSETARKEIARKAAQARWGKSKE